MTEQDEGLTQDQLDEINAELQADAEERREQEGEAAALGEAASNQTTTGFT